jgi:hypothetical protein
MSPFIIAIFILFVVFTVLFAIVFWLLRECDMFDLSGDKRLPRHWQVPDEQLPPDDERDPWQPGKAPRAPRHAMPVWLRVVQVIVFVAIAIWFVTR